MESNPITERVLGQYPLSIATSLAVEGSMGVHPDKPEQTEQLLPKYDVIWVNLKTVFRNLYNAIDNSVSASLKPDTFVDAFADEIEQLKNVISLETASRTEVVLYVSDYAGMAQRYKHATIRTDSTVLQLAYSKAMTAVVGAYVRANPRDIRKYSLKILDSENRKALILTHYAFDLLAKGFKDLSLLESHTGAIKDKYMWYTKYYKGRELAMIPFMETFIQVFGDNEHFRPMSPKIKNEVIALANQYNWSQISTHEKIRYSIDKLQNPWLRDMLRQL